MRERGDEEIDLMRRIRAGQQEAFARLVRLHERRLLGLFRRLGADPHSAEDCAQETFVRVYRYRHEYRPGAPFRSFLYTLARNCYCDWVRSRASRQCPSLDGAQTVADDRGAPLDDRLDLRDALRDLPDHLRWVVVLSVHARLRYAEIAEVLEIPVGTVKSRMFHGIRRMRERLHVRMDA